MPVSSPGRAGRRTAPSGRVASRVLVTPRAYPGRMRDMLGEALMWGFLTCLVLLPP
jgi:hypothetical protein